MSLLITTASRIDNSENADLIYLGEWCILYPSTSEEYSPTVLPYHWDDRDKLYKDYCFLQELNTLIISSLSDRLNDLHDTQHSRKYWDLLLGYWVNLYTAVLYDRWSMVKVAQESKLVDKVCVFDYEKEDFITNNVDDFGKLSENNDDWNMKIYSLLFQEASDIESICVGAPYKIFDEYIDNKKKHTLKKTISSLLQYFSNLRAKNDKVFFIATYLYEGTKKKLLKRFVNGFRFWKIPDVDSIYGAKKPYSRDWVIHSDKSLDEYSELAISFLPYFLPKTFVENYCELVENASKMSWPKNPSVIFTSNCHFSNELFNHWSASKRENGARLIIGEHGGYGVGKFNGGGEFQLRIADTFISTGWSRENYNIKSIGNFRHFGRKQKWDPNGKALMVCVAMPRYSYDMRSMSIASQMINYFNNQFEFVDNLPSAICKDLEVRLYKEDNKWNQKLRWRDRFPNINIDEKNSPIWDIVNNSRLFISTYNASTYIESLFLNIPTIMFWNPEHWEVNETAIHFFNLLEEVGVFHKTPSSAAAHVAIIWEDVESWWCSDKVQIAVNAFCDQYSANSPNMIDILEQTVRDEINLVDRVN